jgi:hypothetical protein
MVVQRFIFHVSSGVTAGSRTERFLKFGSFAFDKGKLTSGSTDAELRIALLRLQREIRV